MSARVDPQQPQVLNLRTSFTCASRKHGRITAQLRASRRDNCTRRSRESAFTLYNVHGRMFSCVPSLYTGIQL
ncbi:hypothetical protein IRJ41_002978 [Triplophysa rosa]|uniref:Uncharacterized protein n=1 Tax=Triplophysa rosa TaxID=992332 RepID=A0A9W7WN58_TRIRA|nr:hypothetical protein IRJ41_002978 [Triplophysa rosa]